jgi:hypothetical protein
VGVNSLCKAIVDLPPASRQFTIKLGDCIEDLNAHELYRILSICGPKAILDLIISEEVFNMVLDRSVGYKKVMNVTYTDKTITKVSKLF